MDRQTRLAMMTEALNTLEHSRDDGDFIIFSDLRTEDYIQLMVIPFLSKYDHLGSCHVSLSLTADPTIPKAQMEVTDRELRADGPPAGMSPLDPLQVAALKDCGFVLSNDHPNYTVFIDLNHLERIAEECEYLFTILGSSPRFDLDVTTQVT